MTDPGGPALNSDSPPPGPADALQVFLASRDVACPHCHYNLRDLNSSRCPECGFELTLPAIRDAAQHRRTRGLLVAFAVLLLLNTLGAWYQWTSTSRARQHWARTGERFRATLATMENRVARAEQRHADAAAAVHDADAPDLTRVLANERADQRTKQGFARYLADSSTGSSWFTLIWWKPSLFPRPHALFLIGAGLSAGGVIAIGLRPRTILAPLRWIIFAAALAANSLFGVILLFR